MATGTVTWFHQNRGFGFIRPEGEGRDLFVHMEIVRKSGMHSLTQGQRVTFEIGEHHGRPAAINLQNSP